jgi:amidohydrolase
MAGRIAGLVAVAAAAAAMPGRARAEVYDARIVAAADALRDKLVAQRRDLHMHPELSNREERTAKVVADRLRALGLEVKTGIAHHGVVAVLKGGRPGPVVAVRADLDALPIQEVGNAPYKSQIPGVKHACGHDVHTTIELGVAEVLSGMRAELPGTVKFIFQPAEEGVPEGEEGGAPLMIKEGALDGPRPSAIFGLHVMSTVPVGAVSFNAGATMAAADRFVVTIHGKKVHGAYPHEGVDAVTVAAECVTALQTIRSRRTDTTEPLVISIGSIHGGNRFNIIADEVRLEGTVRTLSEELRRKIPQLMRQTLGGVTAAYGASYELKYYENAAITYNDPALTARTTPSLKRALGEANVLPRRAQMGAEDFSYYQRVIPGFYYFLGVGNPKKGITAMIHTPEFDVDEDALVVGVKAMTTVVRDALGQADGAKSER